MTELQPAARLVLVFSMIERSFKEQKEAARAGFLDAANAIGAERVRVTDDAGTNLGSVTISAGRVTERIVDEAAFLAWVERNYPSEIRKVVNPAFQKKLVDEAKAKAEPGDPTAIGPDGEVIPGLELVHGMPYPTCRPTDEARERMAALLTRALSLPAAEPKGPDDAAS